MAAAGSRSLSVDAFLLFSANSPRVLTGAFGEGAPAAMEGRMGVSITLVVVIAAIVAGVTALWIYRRRTSASAARRSSNGDPGVRAKKAEQWGVRIAIAKKDKACPQVRGLLGKEFALERKPTLPVKNCPFPQQCECHYVKLFDRRKEERRSGRERRKALRVEAGHQDRRTGKDRRKGKNLDWV